MTSLFAQIPAPSISTFQVGPLTIHLYGVIIAIGVVVAATWMRKRYVAVGGEGDFADNVAFWGILSGFLGGRIGYVIVRMTALDADGNVVKGYYLEHPEKIIAIWEGGLAIFGGLILGGLTVWWLTRKAHGGPGLFFDALAPALPLAQAIGRWGNYFNQELYGTPTNLPWKLYIDPQHRRPGFEQYDFFHPTFLYESFGNLIICGVLWKLSQTGKIVRGGLIWCYGMGYGILRFCMELLRTDTAFRILGLSRNAWVAIIIFTVSAAVLYNLQRGAAKAESVSEVTADTDAATEDEITEDGATQDDATTGAITEANTAQDDAADATASQADAANIDKPDRS